MGRQLFSTVMVLSSRMTLLVSDMAVMEETMQQQQQSMLDSTLQLGNQTVRLIFGNATPINRPTIIRPTMISPSSPTTTTGGAPPTVPIMNEIGKYLFSDNIIYFIFYLIFYFLVVN